MNNELDIKEIVERFEATVAPGDDAGAQAFFEKEFPNFSEEAREALQKEALAGAIERAAEVLSAVNDTQEQV
jgi:hypothetical protein